jgi:hypothetical protein
MKDFVKTVLANPEHPVTKDLLSSSLALLKTSKDYVTTLYPQWDVSDLDFRLQRFADDADKKAERRKEPKKVVLPFAHSQVLTFVAFCILLYNQRPNFFEVSGTGPEDNGTPESDAQKVLTRDLKASKFNSVLYQLLLDLGRWGLCVAKTSWEVKQATVLTEAMQPAGVSMSGSPIPAQPLVETKRQTTFMGTKITPISPYHFFWDVSFPLTRFQEGEFCASEDEYSKTRLKALQAQGVIVNLDSVETAKQEWSESSRFHRTDRAQSISTVRMLASDKAAGTVVITEMQRWIVPADYEIDGEKLGPEDHPVLYLFWIGNWNTILRLEPLNYPHDQFTYDVGQFSHDQHKLVNEGLAELVKPMQDIAGWLLNSRVASVRKIVDSRLFVNPQAVEMQDLVDRKPVIRIKPTAMGTLDMFVKQLNVSDTTQGHMQDIQTVWGFVQTLTGTNENSTGQFSGGRRDATQSRAANAGAASRNKSVATVLWEVFFDPMGQKMLANAQGALTLEEFQRIVGKDADETRFAAFNKRAEGVQNSYDFTLFDGTLPSEKGFIAQSMQELLLGLFENPMAQQLLQDPTFRNLLLRICELRGIPNAASLLPPLIQQAIPPNVIQSQLQPGAPGQPVPGAIPGTAVGPAF